MQRYLKSKKYSLKGKYLHDALQKLEFMRVEMRDLTKAIWRKPRIELAHIVTAGDERTPRVILCIMNNVQKSIQ